MTLLKAKEVNDLPETLEKNMLYIVGENAYWAYSAMLCPCECGDTIYLNLLTERFPYWRIYLSKNKVTVHPSVWRTKNCKSHFIIRKSKIIWVPFFASRKN